MRSAVLTTKGDPWVCPTRSAILLALRNPRTLAQMCLCRSEFCEGRAGSLRRFPARAKAKGAFGGSGRSKGRAGNRGNDMAYCNDA